MDAPLRRSALAGAAIAVAAFALLAVYRDLLDLPFLLVASLVLVVAAALSRAPSPIAARPPDPKSRERHAIAESLLANIPDPVILVDHRAVVIEANPAARALLPKLKLSHPLSFALRAPDVLDGIAAVVRSGAPLRTAYATRVPTERAFEVQIGALPLAQAAEDGRPNVVLFLRDQTSARRLEAMRVDFVANASHELRTPLASLIGFIETLQGPAREDARAREQFLGIMRAQGERMARLIDDLLSLSRIELREHVPPTEKLDLARIAGQIVEEKAPLAAERGVSLIFEAPEAPYAVLGDRDELLRVVENLVENAVRYGSSGGLVELALTRRDAAESQSPQVALSVRDAGPGIAPEHIPRLTERFYRVDTLSSRQQGGTGLGLAIVKHTLNRHRGRLVIESTIGQGTTMRVLLPEHRSGDTVRP